MSAIRSLWVMIKANTAEFLTGMKTASGGVDQFAANTQRANAKTSSWTTGLLKSMKSTSRGISGMALMMGEFGIEGDKGFAKLLKGGANVAGMFMAGGPLLGGFAAVTTLMGVFNQGLEELKRKQLAAAEAAKKLGEQLAAMADKVRTDVVDAFAAYREATGGGAASRTSESWARQGRRSELIASASRSAAEVSRLEGEIAQLKAMGSLSEEGFALLVGLNTQLTLAKQNADIAKNAMQAFWVAGVLGKATEGRKALADAGKDKAEAAKASKKALDEVLDSVRDQLPTVRELVKLERERVRVAMDVSVAYQEQVRVTSDVIENVEKALKDNEEWWSAMDDFGKVTEQAGQEAIGLVESLEEQAEAEERIAVAAREVTSAIRQQLDITQRFESAPGTGGLFGFGAGQVGGKWSQGRGSQRYKVRRGQRGESVTVAGAGSGGLPDPTPALEGATAQLKLIAPIVERMTEAATKHLAAASEQVVKVGNAAATMGERQRKVVNELAAKVKSLEHRMDRAAASTGAGGG